jgi:hypothetical protein
MFPVFFITCTVVGFYLFGDGLKTYYQRQFTAAAFHPIENVDRVMNTIAVKIGIIEN